MAYSEEYLAAVRRDSSILAEELETGQKKRLDYNLGERPCAETRTLDPDEVVKLESWIHGTIPATPP